MFFKFICILIPLGTGDQQNKTNPFTYPLLYPLYNQQFFSGLPHGVTINYFSS